jgi:hypothetical protein
MDKGAGLGVVEGGNQMRRAGRVDANQVATVSYLRALGMSVCILSAMGKGVPDLLVGYRGFNVLLELKDGSKPPSAQKLTADEEDWHAKWAGQLDIVNTPEAAARVVIREWEARINGTRT